MKKIQVVPLSIMEEMRRYLYEYLIELSEFDPDIKFDEKGVPIYKWFDCYWDDKDRFPIYFIVQKKRTFASSLFLISLSLCVS